MITTAPKRRTLSGSIYLRGKTSWVKYYRLSKPYFESSKSRDREVATKLLQKRLGQVATDTFQGITHEKVTISQLIDLGLDDHRFRKLRSLKCVEWRAELLRELACRTSCFTI
jgi:hypothetical protein